MGPDAFFVSMLIGLVATVFVLNLIGLRIPMTRGRVAFRDGLRQVRLWHLAIAFAVMALSLSFLAPGVARSGIPQFAAMVAVAVLLAAAWVREFLFLMNLRDDDLPGRFDKPIWAGVLIVLAPVGLFLFRSYRLSHWPEPLAKPVADVARELA